ncbi:MAG: hypothetical protein U1F98_12710 [Verrucomicrobiota bacterium]
MKFLPILFLGAALALAATGCQTFSDKVPNTLASVTVKNQSNAAIAEATTQVFQNHGFHCTVPGSTQMTFERPGTRKNYAQYGSLVFNETIIIRVTVYIKKLGGDSTELACKAWIVEDPNDPVFEDDHRVRELNRWPYEDLLEDVRKALEK